MKFNITIFYLFISFSTFSQVQSIENLRDSLYEAARKSNAESIFQQYTDSLYHVLGTTANDSVHTLVMVELSNNYKYRKPDSSVFFARKAMDMANTLKLREAELSAISYYLLTEDAIGNTAKALQLSLRLIKLSDQYDLSFYKASGKYLLGYIYNRTKQYKKAIINYKDALNYFLDNNNDTFSSVLSAYLGETYSNIHNRDSSLYYCRLTDSFTHRAPWTQTIVNICVGNVYANFNDQKKALQYLHNARISSGTVDSYWMFMATNEIAKLYVAYGERDSARYYGYEALSLARETGFYADIIGANKFLSDFFKYSDPVKALVYSEAAFRYKDSLSQMERSMAIEDYVSTDEAQRRQELADAKKEFQYHLRINALLGGFFTLLVVAFVLYRSRRAKQKAKQKIENAYDQLKAAQSQLVQSEKMASLGELTAGIAHEIQNPLNFVNNFSEVNTELIDELKSELATGNTQRALEIAEDLKNNEQKINNHGQRADAIVKSMLQHSRGSSDKKEPTDINALADEFLKLAYHGMRARDKNFNAELKTNFDPSLPKIDVVPQDIGRVLVNLINNAFQAIKEFTKVNENMISTARSSKLEAEGGTYKPTVTISTKKLDDKIEIRVADNGPGIPGNIKEKIFQPFFTTKHTGQGTGLGLSLSYDIVKSHGGQIKVETKEGEGLPTASLPDRQREVGTEFIIQLPV